MSLLTPNPQTLSLESPSAWSSPSQASFAAAEFGEVARLDEGSGQKGSIASESMPCIL